MVEQAFGDDLGKIKALAPESISAAKAEIMFASRRG
jgi:hypothetical protein